MKRFGIALVGAFVVSLGLFYLMAVLISGSNLKKPEMGASFAIDFLRHVPKSPVQEKKREKPKKPPEPRKNPPISPVSVAKADVKQAMNLKMDMPKLDAPLGVGDGPFAGGSGGSSTSDSDIIPVAVVEPRHPRSAQLKGIEGFVTYEFDVNKQGLPENFRIVDANPRKVFDDAMRRAVLRWRFKPKVVNGKPVARKNIRQTYDFKLDKEGA